LCNPLLLHISCRVARWFIFKPKIPIWVNFEGLWNGECWHVFGHLENFAAILYTLWLIDNLVAIWYIFPPFWYIVATKMWQPRSLVFLGRATQGLKHMSLTFWLAATAFQQVQGQFELQ
jgi:hypothetical protein